MLRNYPAHVKSRPIGQSPARRYHLQGDSGAKVNTFIGDSIGHCDKKSSYEHVSNSEWLLRGSCLNLKTPLDFCLCSWMKSEVYKRKVATRDKLLAQILDAAARLKECEDQFRRTTRGLRTRVAK
jgi:hypothetical protein